MDGETRYCIAGYATIYQYYAYPANTRPRISQVLILPPFQRKGLGSKLLNTIYRQYFKDDKVVDITGKKLIEINEPNIVLHFPHCAKNYQKCSILIFNFWYFPRIFVLLKMTCLVTLFDWKLQVFKNSPSCQFFSFL